MSHEKGMEAANAAYDAITEVNDFALRAAIDAYLKVTKLWGNLTDSKIALRESRLEELATANVARHKLPND